MTPDPVFVNLTVDEVKLITLLREALSKKYAEITVVIHNGNIASASLTEKFKF